MTPEALYATEASYVWNSLRRLGIATDDLEDQTQEVFLAAFQRLDLFDRERPVRPWLYGIAFNVASHYLRAPRHQREVAAELSNVRDERPGPDDQAQAAQARGRLLRALDELDLAKRSVVVLHEIDGLPIPDVAEVLGIPLNTAYSRLRLARADLAAAVKRMEGSPV